MFKMIMPLAIAIAATALLTPSNAKAYGAAHVGYTHVGPNGVQHYGATEARPGGSYGAAHYGAAGYGGAHYGAAAGGYHYGAAGAGGYHYDYRYSGGAAVGGYRYGYVK